MTFDILNKQGPNPALVELLYKVTPNFFIPETPHQTFADLMFAVSFFPPFPLPSMSTESQRRFFFPLSFWVEIGAVLLLAHLANDDRRDVD